MMTTLTREEFLESLKWADDVLSQDGEFSFYAKRLDQHDQAQRAVLADIMQQTQRYQQFTFGQERSREFEAGFRAAARTLEGWLKAQQKELG